MTRQALTTYLSLCTEYYNLDKHSDRETIDGLAFYTHRAQEACGKILEPMCGTGRFLIPLLEQGFDIEGFDASQHMLDALKQKYSHRSTKQPPISYAFAQDFSSIHRYALIFVPFGSWGLIVDVEESKKALQILYDHLLSGGKLFLEIDTIASVPQCGVWNRNIHSRSDGSYIALNTFCSYEPKTQRFKAVCRYESIVNGTIAEVETEDFYMHLYAFDEMDQLLISVGFTQIQKYADYHKKAADKTSRLLMYECTK